MHLFQRVTHVSRNLNTYIRLRITSTYIFNIMTTERLTVQDRTALMFAGYVHMSAYNNDDYIPHALALFMFKAAKAWGCNGCDEHGDMLVNTHWTYAETQDIWNDFCKTRYPLRVTRAWYLHTHFNVPINDLFLMPSRLYRRYVT